MNIENLQVYDPIQDNDRHIFFLKIDKEPITYTPTVEYKVSFINNTPSLSVKYKSEIAIFNNLYQKAIDNVHENQDKWFEETMNRDALQSMFSPIFMPNINENCIDLHCSFDCSTEDVSIVGLM